MLNETALPSNYKILDKTSLSSNSDDEIQHNIQSNNITEINLEGSITDITSSFSQETIAPLFVGQVFET
ncbi:hypothetical protein C2G38_2182016 [Gigaspora rosea]|uniref:Uncharacterized protein n=1 Tax=Gigaspora rosea TaxID=44941 RepID=A0A397VAD0_9GLOM|nr:hypothetical protein C2G38_2182016 [Gigaspora rosea]